MDNPAAGPKESGFRSFAEFYPFYLSEHRHPVSRALHYLGTWCAVICLTALVAGYAFAWIGHFRFERNRPATFRFPFYSLAGDFRMWWELNLGKLKFRDDRTT
jgi:hypothetical protein